jgi:hypothetical protein
MDRGMVMFGWKSVELTISASLNRKAPPDSLIQDKSYFKRGIET